MIAVTLKKYVLAVRFSEKVFGDRLSEAERRLHLENLYGAVSVPNNK